MNGLPPQPGLWQETRTPEGKVYFYNTVTKATQWSKPIELMDTLERALANQPWKEYTTPEGRKYWSNTETKASTWEMPESYKNALAQAQKPLTPVTPQAPQFVAGGSTAIAPYQDRSFEKEERRFTHTPETNGIPVTTTQDPNYSSFEEAEAAFVKLLRRSNVQPDWTWEQTMRATIKDPQYRALKDPKDRKAAFEKFALEVRAQEKERAKERLAKLRTDFRTMLSRHPEIKHFSRWRTIKPILEGETIFKSTTDDHERRQFFEEYIMELKKKNIEQEAVERKSAMSDLVAILKALDLEPYTRWSEAQGVIQSNERFQNDAKFKLLSKSDVLTAFENHIKSLERTFNDTKQQQKASKARRERQNRDRFIDLLKELRDHGKLNAGSKWMKVLPLIEEDPRYVAMLGQPGSTPLDLFWDMVEEEERALRGRRNDVYDVLEDKQYEVTPKTTFEEFESIMVTDRRTAKIDREALQLIFQRLSEKVLKRNEEEKHAADRHQRRGIDSLRSRIKHLDPPIRATDTWEQIRPRIERTEEYQTLDSDEARKAAFDKVIKRLKEKEEDAERDREHRRHHSRREDDRDHRSSRYDRRSRVSKTPEVDAYEADRRKAMADREKSYRKSSGTTGLSPPPRDRERDYRDRDRDRDRDRERERDRDRDVRRDKNERYGRLERSPPPRRSHYDRERREREEERERMYRQRGDPRGSRDELNYGEDRSVTGSIDRERRRRRPSDADSIDSGRISKRHRREKEKAPRKSKTPPKAEPEPSGVHSGSEEGEIEED